MYSPRLLPRGMKTGNGPAPSVAGSDAANGGKPKGGTGGEKPTKPKAKAAKKSKPSKKKA